MAAHVRQRLLHHPMAGRSTRRAVRGGSSGSARRPTPAAPDRSGGRGRAGRYGGIVDGMQILTVLQPAPAAFAGLCLFLCVLVTVESAR
ncbi:hypothetical protein [Streptomyces europaeiscabiei]|uniref:hypothetical protein n=1 Tax=Streptomyces europaeiscabiei TaxID=146819 RepID=UPI0029B4159B|nr:hypothetical protein [Streptomyces europaeiscabiei]MDX2529782.1 hypothetical protein [Streptomyces europaeiscabiei]